MSISSWFSSVFSRKPNFGEVYGAILDAEWSRYREWAASQVCQGCGAKASDRKRDEFGVVISGVWITEDWCGCKIEGGYKDNRPTFL